MFINNYNIKSIIILMVVIFVLIIPVNILATVEVGGEWKTKHLSVSSMSNHAILGKEYITHFCNLLESYIADFKNKNNTKFSEKLNILFNFWDYECNIDISLNNLEKKLSCPTEDKIIETINDMLGIKNSKVSWKSLNEMYPDEYDPVWSHDNTKIVFKSWRDGNLNLWIRDIKENKIFQLTKNKTNIPTSKGYLKENIMGKVKWSYDGKMIAYVYDEKLWILDCHGKKDLNTYKERKEAKIIDFIFCFDKKHIIVFDGFAHEKKGVSPGVGSLLLLDLENQSVSDLYDENKSPFESGNNGILRCSPNGRFISVFLEHYFKGFHPLWIIDLIQNITINASKPVLQESRDDAKFTILDWSIDSSKLLFIKRHENKIFSVDLNGEEKEELLSTKCGLFTFKSKYGSGFNTEGYTPILGEIGITQTIVMFFPVEYRQKLHSLNLLNSDSIIKEFDVVNMYGDDNNISKAWIILDDEKKSFGVTDFNELTNNERVSDIVWSSQKNIIAYVSQKDDGIRQINFKEINTIKIELEEFPKPKEEDLSSPKEKHGNEPVVQDLQTIQKLITSHSKNNIENIKLIVSIIIIVFLVFIYFLIKKRNSKM